MEKNNKQQTGMNDEEHLEFKVGPLRFCASVLDVEVIISPPKMIHLPLSDHVVAGCFDHQGKTATVISLHNKFGLPFALKENKSHIILALVDDELKGFWIDQAIDIIKLNNYESNADYAPNKRKAYSNFLTGSDVIILQTSFDRLYKCDSSNLRWLAKLGKNNNKVDDEAEPENIAIIEAEKVSTNSQNNEPISSEEKVADVREPEKSDARNTVIEIKNTANEYEDNFKNKKDRTTSFNSASKNSAYENRNNVSRAAAQVYGEPAHAPEIVVTRTYNSGATPVLKTENKSSNENLGLFVLLAGMLALLIIGLGSIYLLNTDSGSAFEHSEKMARVRDSYITAEPTDSNRNELASPSIDNLNQREDGVETAGLGDALVSEMTPSKNETLNEVAQEDESMPDRSENARVFELHVDEKSDSNLYAITKFEPVVNQQEQFPKENQKSTSTAQTFTHVVIKGDTLWHITRRYLDNPHRYPELAAASHINNPHRIYPGDIVKIIVNKTKAE